MVKYRDYVLEEWSVRFSADEGTLLFVTISDRFWCPSNSYPISTGRSFLGYKKTGA
jgi:hypothetical protein